jgi:hypothetical protein
LPDLTVYDRPHVTRDPGSPPDPGRRSTTGDDTTVLVIEKFRWLRLPAMAGAALRLLEQAAAENPTLTDVIHRFTDEERQVGKTQNPDARISRN